ncbi:MAG: ribonuclease HIII [Candidatus Delongbacteria bacterium]|nr:ribonuclease HIII [Candidatus Delongbacteria bacterium]
MQKVIKVSSSEIPALLERIGRLYPDRHRRDYHWQFDGPDCKIMVYDTGTIMIQGKQIPDDLLPMVESRVVQTWGIGTDESGKGDIFGGICVAAAYVDETLHARVRHLRITDSKVLSEKQLHQVGEQLESVIPHRIIRLDPAEYNQMYQRFNNINLMLADLHAQAAESVMELTGCRTVICDQFSQSPAVLRKAMPPSLHLIQEHHAESRYISVAAASILARRAFIRHLDQLSQRLELTLPRGATISRRDLYNLTASISHHDMQYVAKLHFKPIRQRLGLD